MFVDAVRRANEFTRCIHTIERNYKSDKVRPSSANIFFVNEEGCAVTCGHVLDMLIAGEQIYKNYRAFIEEKKNLHDDYRYDIELEELEEKYKLGDNKLCDLKNSFVNCVAPFGGFDYYRHPKYDVAIIRFKNFTSKGYQNYAVFTKEDGNIEQGKSLCRLGFPFPEFNNFKYSVESDEILWTKEGRNIATSFPLEGIVTRNVNDDQQTFAVEMSTPGFKGMSGAPLFDIRGVVYGMQSQIAVIPDVSNPIPFNVVVNGNQTVQTTSPFLTLGRCIHAKVIKDFLKEHNIKYYVEDTDNKYSN